jgi:hypothetical protein
MFHMLARFMWQQLSCSKFEKPARSLWERACPANTGGAGARHRVACFAGQASFYQTKDNPLFFLTKKQVRGVNGGEVFTLLYVVTASCADRD